MLEGYFYPSYKIRIVLEVLAHYSKVSRVGLISNLANPLDQLLEDFKVVVTDLKRPLVSLYEVYDIIFVYDQIFYQKLELNSLSRFFAVLPLIVFVFSHEA